MSRKRVLSLLLALVCLMVMLPADVFADDVCFIAVNDTLLELNTMPVFSGTTVYVPSRVFDSFHIYYTFFSADNTALVYTGAKQFYFDLSNGNTYDSSNNYYSTQAILRNGEVYLPAKFICGQFGLSYSFIEGTGCGDIFRITDGSAVLSDSRFLSAASTLMESHYNAYMGLTPAVAPAEVEEEPDRHETDVMLCFVGMPSEALLTTLNNYSAKAGFFLTPAEMAEAPDTLRRLVGEGHTVGVCCGEDPPADCESAETLLFDAAHVVPLMLVPLTAEFAEVCREYAASAGLVTLCPDAEVGEGSTSALAITTLIEFSEQQSTVLFRSQDTAEKLLPAILQYLKQNQFSIRAPRETDGL